MGRKHRGAFGKPLAFRTAGAKNLHRTEAGAWARETHSPAAKGIV